MATFVSIPRLQRRGGLMPKYEGGGSDGSDGSERLSYRDLFRQMTEEYRRGREEMHELRAAVSKLEATLEPVAKLVRGNGGPGIIGIIDRVSTRVEVLNSEVEDMKKYGTHPSQLSLRVLQQKDTQQDNRMDESDRARHELRNDINVRVLKLETDRLKMEQRFSDKQWHTVTFIILSGLTLVGVLLSIGLHFIKGN